MLLQAGKRYDSITLEADARHLLTDVWTTAGVLTGIALVWLTGYVRLDPIVALLVAINILYTGYRLLRRSAFGLMDVALPTEDLKTIEGILDSYQTEGIRFHGLRTRRAAAVSYVVVHVLVPGEWTVEHGHKLADKIETQVKTAVPNTRIVTHIEPVEDPISLRDAVLEQE